MRGGGFVGQNVEDLDPVFHAMPGANLAPEHAFFAEIVHGRSKDKFATHPRPVNGPPREAARYFNNIFLGITSIHAQGVEFHHFASVVFIQAAPVIILSRLGLALCLNGRPVHAGISKRTAAQSTRRSEWTASEDGRGFAHAPAPG